MPRIPILDETSARPASLEVATAHEAAGSRMTNTDPSIVEEHVDAFELRHRSLEARRDGCVIAYVRHGGK